MSKLTDYEQSLDKAFWLLRNTKLTFRQIAHFCSLDPLEVANIENRTHNPQKTGYNPVLYGEITHEDIEQCESNPKMNLPVEKNHKKKGISKKKSLLH